MAIATDESGIQFRILNSSKGPAVRATRAQADRILYKAAIRHRREWYPDGAPAGSTNPDRTVGLSRTVTRDERDQAEEVLVAGGAADQMRAHAREALVGGAALQRQFDVDVERVEALVAADFGLAGAGEGSQEAHATVVWSWAFR